LPGHYYFVVIGLFAPQNRVVLGSQIDIPIGPPIGVVFLSNVNVGSKARANRIVFAEVSRKFDS